MALPEQLQPSGELDLEGKYYAKLLWEELEKVSDNPTQDLTQALRQWVESEKGKNGNGRKKFADEVDSLLQQNELQKAVMQFVYRQPEIHLMGSVARALRESRKLLAVSFKETEKILLKAEPSPTFRLGGSAHRLIEKVVAAEGDLEAVREKRITPKTDDASAAMVTGLTMSGAETFNGQDGRRRIRKVVVPKAKQETFLDPVPKTPTLEVSFSYPLPVRNENQSMSEYIKSIFYTSLEKIIQINGLLPEKPSDVERVFAEPLSRAALMQLVEAGHMFFGFNHYLSAVSWEDESHGIITAENVDAFAALNWMAIARKAQEMAVPQEHSVILTEIPEGPLNYSEPHGGDASKDVLRVQGNKIDTLVLTLQAPSSLSAVNSWGLKTVFRYLEGYFNTQYERNKSYRTNEDGTRTIKETRLRQNVRTVLTQMYKYFGEKLFTHLNATVKDWKFPGGDGGWAEQYDPEDLPAKKDVEQVSGYIVKILSQLFWVRKMADQAKGVGDVTPDGIKLIPFPERDDITVNLAEVIDFALETGLINRIKAYLLYQLPGREISCPVVPRANTRDELVLWAYQAIKLDNPKVEQRDRLRVARAVISILKPSLGDLEIKRKEPKRLPEALSEFCLQYKDRIYLSIEDLEKRIDQMSLNETQDSFRALQFRNMDVKVFWVKGIIDGDETLRIAIGKSANFAISSPTLGVVRGRLVSSRDYKGVNESTNKLNSLFERKIWGVLDTYWRLSEPAEVSDYIQGDEIIMPNGAREKLVPGKPVVCRYDLMTGKWLLDYKLLEEAVGADAGRTDHLGMHELSQLVNRGNVKGKAIWCPMPTHNNTRTRAAIFDEGSINCQNPACDAHIYLPPRHGKIRVASQVTPKTDSLIDFKPVSDERANTFQGLMDIGRVFAASDNLPQRYVIEKRGLSPSDLGLFGYIPLGLNALLSDIVYSQAFREICRKVKNKANNGLGNMEGLANLTDAPDRLALLNASQEAISYVEGIPNPEQRSSVLNGLNLRALLAMRTRGILDTKYRLGGRIILPTYWISSTKEGQAALVQSNFNARGIEIDGETQYREQPHHKAYLSGRRNAATPVGFYIGDVEKFFLDLQDYLIICEGPFNSASLRRLQPALPEVTVTNVGLGYRELIAFLRWLGVDKDTSKEGRGLSHKIKTVFLAFDFDQAGATGYIKRAERLKAVFPNLDIRPIHELLTNDVRPIVPEFNPDLFAEGGKFHGFKLDLNDLLMPHDSEWPIKNAIDLDTVRAIEEIRREYAFRLS